LLSSTASAPRLRQSPALNHLPDYDGSADLVQAHALAHKIDDKIGFRDIERAWR